MDTINNESITVTRKAPIIPLPDTLFDDSAALDKPTDDSAHFLSIFGRPYACPEGLVTRSAHFAQATTTSDNLTASPFLEMPQELRDKIYEMSLQSQRLRAIECYMFTPSTVSITNMPHRGLLYANKQIKAEYKKTLDRIKPKHRVVIEGKAPITEAENREAEPGRYGRSRTFPLSFASLEMVCQRVMQNPKRQLPGKEAVQKTVELLASVESLDIHFANTGDEWSAFRGLVEYEITPDICIAYCRMMPHMKLLKTMNVVLHLATPNWSDQMKPLYRERETLLEIDRALWNCFFKTHFSNYQTLTRHRWRQHGLKTHLKILTMSSNFFAYSGSYPVLDPSGRYHEFVRNHPRNQLLLEWSVVPAPQVYLHAPPPDNWLRSLEVLTSCDPATYSEVTNDVLGDFLAVYEGEKSMKDLEKKYKLDDSGGLVMHPTTYGDYLESKLASPSRKADSPNKGLGGENQGDEDE